ncbi:M24 family metallopeptidase [Ornithinimicrobium cavernae]|uniref:M24 family metallopeptidase n=1 Tax=Ornithinimicrobium cavernae TaxID=2666047 RepID=UPI001379C287|nr:Xaa-Pro peptidase family protein [Ornithinimicrobium cavernae]
MTPEVPVRSLPTADELLASPEERREIRADVRGALADAGVTGYVAITPSNVFYTSGYVSYFLSSWWRMHGSVFTVLSVDDPEVHLIVGDAEEVGARAGAVECEVRAYPMWVETRGLAGIEVDPGPEPHRPSQWRTDDIDELLKRSLTELGLTSGRVGTDLQHIPHATLERMRRVAPDVEWVDVTDMLYGVRAIKRPFEVARLTTAARLAEAGMEHVRGVVQPEELLSDVRSHFFEGVASAARSSDIFAEFSDLWVLPGMGQRAAIDSSRRDSQGLRPGDLLKFDCGTTVGGYRSDGGRTFVLGDPDARAARLYATLQQAHALAVGAIAPGVKVRDVYAVAAEFMHAEGYPGYRRGHFGHSIGLDSFHEEPPFLGADDTDVLEQGMVLAVETPFYGGDLGPIMIEDLIHITDSGAEYLTALPRELRRISG